MPINTLSEDLSVGEANYHFYWHLGHNPLDDVFYKIIKISEDVVIVETYNVNGIRTEPTSNKDFNICDDGKSIINLEHFLEDKRAEFFKLKRFSYRRFI